MITFQDGSTVLGAGTLNTSGVATFTTTATQLTAEAHTITAVYGGDAGYQGSTGTLQGGQTVNQAGTTATITSSSSNNTSAFGQAVTFSATVTSSSAGAGTLSGTVSFYDGSNFLGRSTLDANGLAPPAELVVARRAGRRQRRRQPNALWPGSLSCARSHQTPGAGAAFLLVIVTRWPTSSTAARSNSAT
jgi:hypothetical protein